MPELGTYGSVPGGPEMGVPTAISDIPPIAASGDPDNRTASLIASGCTSRSAARRRARAWDARHDGSRGGSAHRGGGSIAGTPYPDRCAAVPVFEPGGGMPYVSGPT